MAKSDQLLYEREVNRQAAVLFEARGLLVLREIRVNPCEIDLVLLDPGTARLAAIEIKRQNWRELLHQAERRQLYCHFSVAMMPVRMRSRVPLTEFSKRGIGVIFYEEMDKHIQLFCALFPRLSESGNRALKKVLYTEFSIVCREKLYA